MDQLEKRYLLWVDQLGKEVPCGWTNQRMVPEHRAWGADSTPTLNLSAKCPHAVQGCEAGLPEYLVVSSGQVLFSGESGFLIYPTAIPPLG